MKVKEGSWTNNMINNNFSCFSEYTQFISTEMIYRAGLSSSGCHRNCFSFTYENEMQDFGKEGKNVIRCTIETQTIPK